MAPLRVRGYTREDALHWDRFVELCPDATFFHRSGWKEVIEGCFGHRTHYLLAERASGIAGVLPLAEVENNPLNPRYRALIALWRRLPMPLANFLGPHLVKSLG